MTHVYKVLLSSAPPLTSFSVNSTLGPEAICCCLQTSTYCCFYQGGEIYMYRNVRSQNFYIYFLSYMDTCIAIIMYCQRLFLLVTGQQHCLHKFFWGEETYLR